MFYWKRLLYHKKYFITKNKIPSPYSILLWVIVCAVDFKFKAFLEYREQKNITLPFAFLQHREQNLMSSINSIFKHCLSKPCAFDVIFLLIREYRVQKNITQLLLFHHREQNLISSLYSAFKHCLSEPSVVDIKFKPIHEDRVQKWEWLYCAISTALYTTCDMRLLEISM